jgi:branched-chain amino acid transport system substrate-binding protein
VFRLVPTHDLQATVIVEYALNRLLCTQPLIVNDTTQYGVDLGQKIEQVFRQKEVDVALRIPITPVSGAGTDYSAVVTSIERNDATCVVFAGYYQEASVLVRQIRAAGRTEPILLTDGSFQRDLLNGAGQDIEAVYVAFVAPDWGRIPEAKPLLDAFHSEFPDADPSYAPFGADAIRIVRQALAEAQSGFSRSALLKSLETPSFTVKGLAGDYHFNSLGDAEGGVNYIYRVAESADKRWFECVTCR